MAKRQADTELNHDNWDQEDKKEEAGTFRPISNSMLQNRIIKKAKRTLKSDSDGSPSSPFSAFSGFSKQSPQPAFTFRMAEGKEEKNTGDNNAESKEIEAKNGCSGTPENKFLSDVQKDNLPSQRQSSSEETKPDNKKFEYFRQLQKLNESVLKWMQMHIAKNPCCDFTPVFNDYRSHLQRLERLYPVQKKVEAKSPFADASKSTAFKMTSFPTTSKTSDSKSPSTHKAGSGFFQIGKKPNELISTRSSSSDSEMKYGAGFASNTTNTSTCSFGIKTSTATTPGSTVGISSTSSAKKKDNEEKDETSGFSFGFKSNYNQTLGNSEIPKSENKPFQFFPNVSNSATTENVNEEEVEYVPPKNEFTPVSEEDALYSKRCKLFFKKDDAYVDRGVGTIYLKALDGKTQLLIRADTSLGNILLNIILSASLPMERTGKNNVLIVCVPNPPLDVKDPDSKKAIPLLIRVKTSDDADELFKKLDEYKS